MNKKERKLLEYMLDNSDYSADFNAINNRIVIDDSMLNKKKKKFPILLALSSALSSIVVALILIIPNLKNNNQANMESSLLGSDSVIQMMPENSQYNESIEENFPVTSEDCYEESTSNMEPGDVMTPEESLPIVSVSFNGITYNFNDVVFNPQLVGEKIGETEEGYNVYQYTIDEENYVIIQVEEEYYLLKKEG